MDELHAELAGLFKRFEKLPEKWKGRTDGHVQASIASLRTALDIAEAAVREKDRAADDVRAKPPALKLVNRRP